MSLERMYSGSAFEKNHIGVVISIAPILRPSSKTCLHESVFCYFIQSRKSHYIRFLDSYVCINRMENALMTNGWGWGVLVFF